MLRLSNVTKNYKVAGGEIEVLKGLNIAFRKNEFVSILGPSGCGKTTTLNIVGGLDKYTSGDLIIAGKSTKNFTDRDWDVYRNQRIGFVFQSYNLIPHQTVLGNVELALTISGVSKEERVKRSIAALDKVGLQGEYYKRPNQLSGGQCQRVAIARALVNEPDILLADEPTGALDSKTSVQIMELIKEISKDKLVIMVTHNAEIAEQYSTRIVRLVDGEIVEDSAPFSVEDEIKEVEESKKAELELEQKEQTTTKKKKKAKAKMSIWTAFRLSLRNLFTKRGRTIMTSVAGSIGIIGISAVLAVSSGVRMFIANMQDDMLSGNPISIEETGYDFSSMMDGLSFGEKVEFVKEEGYVNVDSMIEYLAKQYKTMDSFMVTNDLTKDYLDYVAVMPKDYGTVNFDYGLDVTNNIYTDYNVNEQIGENVSLSGIRARYTSIMKQTQFAEQSSLISSLGDIYMQSIPDSEYILSQYDIIDGGKIATEKNEIMLVVNDDQTLTDLTLAQLGYYVQEDFMDLIYRVDDDTNNDPDSYKNKFSFEELKEKKFVWYANEVVFNENLSGTDALGNVVPFTYNDSYDDNSTKFDATINGNDKIELEIVGILMPKDSISYGCLEAGMYYTDKLTEHIITQNLNSKVVEFLENIANINADDDVAYGGMVANGIAISVNNSPIIPFNYTYYFEDYNVPLEANSMVGTLNTMSSLISNMMGGGQGGDMYSITTRQLGGEELANSIKIYPTNFDIKDKVTEYLDKWNEEGDVVVGDKTIAFEEREEVKYTDNLSIIIAMINTMIDVITIALIAFTSLALVVSCVMIAIITYVSVVERVKEIGVIRSLGGRKRDVANLFNAETLAIGTASGLFGIGFTYLLSAIVNVIVQNAAGFSIMALPLSSAGIMLLLSIGLTVLSGLIPSRKAAHQDPVVALRTE
ncbi:MAG: ABC transporter ATP-binding protein/permease [Clostridia bacterium]|nr:ABC transporter ATP-binding protein/permease [Clostridia bacterium]